MRGGGRGRDDGEGGRRFRGTRLQDVVCVGFGLHMAFVFVCWM